MPNRTKADFIINSLFSLALINRSNSWAKEVLPCAFRFDLQEFSIDQPHGLPTNEKVGIVTEILTFMAICPIRDNHFFDGNNSLNL